MSETCFVYMIHAERHAGKLHAVPIKVGISRHPRVRLDALQTANPHRLTIAALWLFTDRAFAQEVERLFHRENARAQLSGEWFLTWPLGAAHEIDESAFDLWKRRGLTDDEIQSACIECGIDVENFADHLAEHDA